MLCNDITNFDYLRFGTDFINDKAIKALKSVPNGKSFTWVYGEILVLAAETDGIITTDETFPTIADQIAAQLYMITPEEVDKVLKYFTGIGYIKVEGQQYKFLQVPAFIKHETGAAARKENQRQNQKQDNTFQGTSLSPNTFVEQSPEQQQTRQHIHRKRDNNNNNKEQQTGNIKKRIFMFENWGIEINAAKNLAQLPHVQAYSDEFLKELLAYASKRSRDNLPGYLRAMLEKPKLVLHGRSIQKREKIYNPNCPKCHGTGTYTVKVDNGNDYTDDVVIHCDCWKKYRTGGAAK